MAIFILLAGPVTDTRLRKRYAAFRKEHQAEHDRLDAKFQHRDVEVSGLKWHYVEQGPADGLAVILLHGLPEGWYSWAHVIPLLNKGLHLIVPDMKGYGRSEGADNDFDWHTVASQTLALMDHLKIGKFYIVGHDWGALIGNVLVDDHQDRILGFVRMEADFVPSWKRPSWQNYLIKPHWVIFRVTWMTRMIMRDVKQFIEFVYIRSQRTRMTREDLDYFIYEYSRPGVVQRVSLYFKRSNWDLKTALGKFCKNKYDFPVMALQADHDFDQPVYLFANAATECPCVELRWIKDAGHFDNLEQTGQVADAINDFIVRSRTWKKQCA